MTLAQIRKLTETLNTILMQTFSFNDIKITMNYAARAKHAKNWVVDTHYHPWFEFNYVSKGSLYTTINGTEFLVTAGSSYIIPPGIPHSHRHNGTGDDGICIRFSLNGANENRIISVLSLPYTAPFISGIEKIHLSGGTYCIQAGFALWLMRLFDLRDTVPAHTNPVQNTFAMQVTMYLKEYYKDKIKVSDIANALNTSYRTLARKFAEETGMSVSEKLTEIRIDKAKQLLISTKMSIRDIAAETGYESEFYFSKKFKQKEHIPPATYRILHRIYA